MDETTSSHLGSLMPATELSAICWDWQVQQQSIQPSCNGAALRVAVPHIRGTAYRPGMWSVCVSCCRIPEKGTHIQLVVVQRQARHAPKAAEARRQRTWGIRWAEKDSIHAGNIYAVHY